MGLGDMLHMCLFSSGFGWVFGLLAFLFSFWSATLILLIPMLTGKVLRKSKIPFIPFQLLGMIIALLLTFVFVR
jgi:prepilin signal peptidase PulO-like enzyme (type II secretory pathway)